MNKLILVGLSHKTAPIQVREKVAFAEDSLESALGQLSEEAVLRESLILSTCNRVELIADSADQQDGHQKLTEFLCRFHSVDPGLLDDHLYSFGHTDAVRHVFRVASSLDSMVVGEPQILFQLKEAFRTASEAGCVGKSLNSLIPRAFFVAKRVRSETQVATSAVSVSSVAVELAEKIFGDLRGKSILMLGAGKMGELAGRSLVDSGVSNVYVTNRTSAKAENLARRFHGNAIPYEEIDDFLAKADIVLVSTGARQYILDRARLHPILRRRRFEPLFLIDISVPRNVDPHVNEMENVFLYDIDDLQSVIESNLDERKKEAEIAERIVEEEVLKFFRTHSNSQLAPVITRLRGRVEELCLMDLRKSQNGMDPAQYAEIERLLLRAAHKVAHPLIVDLKKTVRNPSQQVKKMEMLREIFSLDDSND